MKRRVTIIAFTSILFLAAVVVVGESLRAEKQPLALRAGGSSQASALPAEVGVFRRAQRALTYLKSQATQGTRTLEQHYSRRAFNGAPPVIPHQVFDEKGIGGKGCLACHAEGEFIPMLKAYAPVVPHPELSNCKQCHVAKENVAPFRATSFVGEKPPAIHWSAMPGSPPPIPHSLDMRNNCLACHAGPSAPKEVRTSHPSRVNCRQCHAAKEP